MVRPAKKAAMQGSTNDARMKPGDKRTEMGRFASSLSVLDVSSMIVVVLVLFVPLVIVFCLESNAYRNKNW